MDPMIENAAPSPAEPTTPRAGRPWYLDTAFIVVAALLLLAAVGLNATVAKLKLTFRKDRVELRSSLKEVALNLGPWVQVTVDERLPHEVEETLGTEEYISRSYVDSRQVPKDQLDAFKGKSRAEVEGLLARVKPEAVMHMGVYYYTGMVDTVAHIPERCYVADGFVPSNSVVEPWSCFNNRGDDRAAARFIQFEDEVQGRAAPSRNVAYFFNVNGRYTNDPLDVRATLQNLFEKYGYYCKIELMSVLNDRNKASASMNDFLTSALPQIEKSLPDWQRVHADAVSAASRH